MGRDLSLLQIKDSYQYLLQKSGSEVNDGVGNDVDYLNISASYAYTSSEAIHALDADTATSASHAVNADTAISASYATSALSASFATTASFALNVPTIDTGSFYNSSSIADALITFYQADGSTESVLVNNVSSSISASHAVQADNATTADSATTATSASHALYADSAGSATTATSASHAIYSDTAGSATTATSASHAVNADTAISSSYALTASYAEFHADSTLQQVLNAGNTATGSIDLDGNITATTFIGSLTGNADTATSASHALNADNAISASFATTASYATTALSASHALHADTATTASYALTASALENPVNLQSVLDAGNTATQDMTLNGVLKVSGSTIISGSQYGLLEDNENIETYYNPTTNGTTPNILIGAKVGAFDATGTNNILIGSSHNATGNSNRFEGVSGTNYSNAIIGGTANMITGSAGGRSINIILGGNGNVMGKDNLAVTISNNAIVGGYFHDIFAGSYNFTAGGTSHNIYTSSAETSPSYNAILAGGSHDINGGDYNGFLAGYNHTMTNGKQSAFVGGENNIISQSVTTDMDSVIVGGRNNTIAEHQRSVILGGDGLATSKNDEVVAKNLTISGDIDGSNNLVVTGGTNIGISSTNTMTGISGSGIFGGHDNNVSGNVNATLGGRYNQVSDNQGTNVAVGGEYHQVNGFRCGAVGGESNQVGGTNVVAVSGYGNVINGTYSAFAGGNGNNIGGTSYFVGGVANSNGSGYIYSMIGGNYLDCQTDSTLLGGGENNTSVSGHRKGAIIGGEYNKLNGSNTDRSVVIGGSTNIIQSGSQNSVILGGQNITSRQSDTAYVQNLTISGSVSNDNIGSIAIASSTGSMDCLESNFHTLTLASGVDTHLVATNIQVGQTLNLKITNDATSAGTISFGSMFEFENGVPFSATGNTSAVDVMTFISFDGTTLQATGLKNFS